MVMLFTSQNIERKNYTVLAIILDKHEMFLKESFGMGKTRVSNF
jgi:hypothetical protein